jgi:DNA-directed RNA polymerase specialized sigma24 family protein
MSIVAALSSGNGEERARAWDRLVELYWKPSYKYVRLKWNAAEEDAQDWTQGFFARAFEKDYFAKFDPEKASFHTFLRVCLDGYVANERQAAATQKRGGQSKTVPLEFVTAEGELREQQIPDGMPLEQYFEREWIRSLFESCVRDLKDDAERRGREVAFAIFEHYDLESVTQPSYAELAERYQLPVTQVTNYLAAMRRDFRRIVLARLREVSASESEYRTSARALLGKDPI